MPSVGTCQTPVMGFCKVDNKSIHGLKLRRESSMKAPFVLPALV